MQIIACKDAKKALSTYKLRLCGDYSFLENLEHKFREVINQIYDLFPEFLY